MVAKFWLKALLLGLVLSIVTSISTVFLLVSLYSSVATGIDIPIKLTHAFFVIWSFVVLLITKVTAKAHKVLPPLPVPQFVLFYLPVVCGWFFAVNDRKPIYLFIGVFVSSVFLAYHILVWWHKKDWQ